MTRQPPIMMPTINGVPGIEVPVGCKFFRCDVFGRIWLCGKGEIVSADIREIGIDADNDHLACCVLATHWEQERRKTQALAATYQIIPKDIQRYCHKAAWQRQLCFEAAFEKRPTQAKRATAGPI